jgi:hypothetical protein
MNEYKSLLGMGDDLPFNFIRNRKAHGERYEGSGNLSLSGSLTITGDLVVQQSNHVYLRGPITSSRILVNGPITSSNVWVRSGSGGYDIYEETTKDTSMGNIIVDSAITASNLWVKNSFRMGENREMVLVTHTEYEYLKQRVDKLEEVINKLVKDE